MDTNELTSERGALTATAGHAGPDWAERATDDRRQEWSSDQVLDQGDTHDKGERSLCVGEAA